MTIGEKKSVWACISFFGGWTLVSFTIGDYFQWHNHLGIFMLVWLFTFFWLIRTVYREGNKQKKEEEAEKEKKMERQLFFLEKVLNLRGDHDGNK